MNPNTKKALFGAGVAVLVIAGMVVILNHQTSKEENAPDAAVLPEPETNSMPVAKAVPVVANPTVQEPSLADLISRADRPADGKVNLPVEQLKDVVLVYSIDLKLAPGVKPDDLKDALPKFIRISTANGKTVEELFTQMPAPGIKPMQASLSTPPPCLPLAQRYNVLTYSGTETVNNEVCDVLTGKNEAIDTASKLYLDRKNGRLVRSTEPGVIQYGTYQTINGVTLPETIVADVDKNQMNFKLVSVEVNKGISDTRFDDAAKAAAPTPPATPDAVVAPATPANTAETAKQPEATANSNVFLVRHYDLLDQYTIKNSEIMMPLIHLAGAESVKEFQAANQLKPDGVFGPKTLNVLRQKLGDKKVEPLAKLLPQLKQPLTFAFSRSNNNLQVTIANHTEKTINFTTPLHVNIAPISPKATLDYVPATGQIVQLVTVKQPILAGKSVTVTVKKGTASEHWAGKVKGIFLFDGAYTYRP